ncbi:DUF1287 domain-containing protein [Chryseomicrobium sp. FSL W7-1435]|uniref:DUF1287 domain-containing protein n=1 Tax=Chryseomicrobium sp. FSL W7-1435 TaxID=2921704 RepID=UPI00315A3B4E
MKKRYLVVGILITLVLFSVMFRGGVILQTLGVTLDNPFAPRVEVEDRTVWSDRNGNGITDQLDIVAAARVEVENRTTYQSAYYGGGYPPDDEGVCTDVIWRGLLGADIVLKDEMDADIAANVEAYPRTEGTPDPNIDFRRVPNQYAFLERHAESLTTDLIAGDLDNLAEWQPGDIVIFLEGTDHAGIISDKRAKDGTPYMIHNMPPFAAEIKLSSYKQPIAGHYRWKFGAE